MRALGLLAISALTFGDTVGSGDSIEASAAVESLRARDREVAREAVLGVFESGEAALPSLLALRGDQRPFVGGALGHPRSAQATIMAGPGVEREQIVTVEVAALYMIEAIYRGRVDFAQSAYLTDFRLPEDERTAANTQDRIERAWTSVLAWAERSTGRPLEELRRQGDDPLSASGVGFW